MSQLSLATRLALINSWADAPVVFLQQVGNTQNRLPATVANAALATGVFIAGHGQYDLSQITYVRAVKPVNGQKNKISVDATVPAQITVVNNLVRGDVLVFRIKMETTDSRSEFASHDWKDSRYFAPFEYRAVGNDTEEQVLAGLYKQISQIKDLFPEADGSGEPYTVAYDAAAKVLTLEANDAHLSVELFRDDLFLDNVDLVPVFAPVTVAEQFDGRGTYTILKNIIHETDGSNEVYSHSKRSGLPQRNVLYTTINFGVTVSRPELSGAGAAGQVIFQRADFCYYVQESAANDTIADALLTFFNRITGNKEFIKGDIPGTPGTLADLVGAAIPVADPSTEDPTNT